MAIRRRGRIRAVAQSHAPRSRPAAASPFPVVLAALSLLVLCAPAPAAQYDDLADFERKVDATLRAACHGYTVDMLPDALAGIRTWLYEKSPVCTEVVNLPKDAPLRDRFANLPMSQRDVERIYDRDAWRYPTGQGAVDQHIGFECEWEYMCVTQRRRLSRTPHPVSQADYARVAASCASELSEYHCIEKFFSAWPQPLPAATAVPGSPGPVLGVSDADAGPAPNSLDQLLAGADEAIDAARSQQQAQRQAEQAQQARAAELARLERERKATIAAIDAERKRLIERVKRKEEAEAAKRRNRAIFGAITGAALAGSSSLSSQGKVDFFTNYVTGVVNNEDVRTFQQRLGGTATRELERHSAHLKSLEAEYARRQAENEKAQAEATRAYREGAQRSYENAKAQGIQATDPNQLARLPGGADWSRQQVAVAGPAGQAPAPAPRPAPAAPTGCGPAGNGGPTVGPLSLLDAKYLGTYADDYSSVWQINGDGSGTWTVGMRDGRHERVAIRWQPMADSNCSIQRQVSGDKTSVLVFVEYANPLNERVKGAMNSSGRDRPNNMLRFACASDGRCEAQFYGQMNAWYMKR